ncbi:hypothetical protein POV27_03660 [Aureisphaera galaxeae]|uniref:hypothetical protein n=1 Tax=Aureisphaera galaxeae TaxID=1538023 RepID=UPI0023506AC6|nr:hypothetical protein [Aureisphaera galaxeae]MDC8003131.1 hypothetical protein [Aureisphaera galaxeae]
MMKTLVQILVIVLLLPVAVMGQTKRSDATPLNPFTVRYHKSQFNLKGPVKQYNDWLGTFHFNEKGYLLKDESLLGLTTDFHYDSSGNLYKIVSTYAGSPVTYNVILDSNKNVLIKATALNIGEKYTYDSKGNVLEKYRLEDNELQNRYTYDSQNRLIRSDGFYNAINETSTTTYSYANESGYLKVSSHYKSSNPEKKENRYVSYYKDGEYSGQSKNSAMKYDKHGNPLSYLDKFGKVSSEKSYVYFGEEPSSSTSSVSTPQVNTPSSVSATSSGSGCSGDCQNGWGYKTYGDDYYEGFWKNGQRDGYGMYYWTGTGKHIGFWKEGKQEGFGVYLADGGDSKTGMYKNGKMNGNGYSKINEKWERGYYVNGSISTPYNFYDNKVETGCIAGDCQNSYGRYKWSNGDVFTGYFKNGVMHMGYYSFVSGDAYAGMFNSKGQFHGGGRYFFKDKAYYGGLWDNGKYHGRGYYHDKDLKQQIGEWSQGVLSRNMK